MLKRITAMVLVLLTACGAAPVQTTITPTSVPQSISEAVPAPEPTPSPTAAPTATPTPSPTPMPTATQKSASNSNTYPKAVATGSIYSLNPTSYTYHPIIGTDGRKVIAELTAYKQLNDVKLEEKPIDLLGFLVKYSDESKESFSVTKTQLYSNERGVLDATAEQCQALHDLAKVKNNENTARAQWLSYMSPKKMTKVSFNGNASDDNMTDISFITDNAEIMTYIAEKLDCLSVKPESTKKTEGKVNFDTPATLMTIQLTFDSGVVYDVYITGDLMSVMSSDMSYSLYYTLTSADVGEGLRKTAEHSYYRLHPELELPEHLIPNPDAKPIIYLYPEKPTDITVKLDYKGELWYTFPAYNDGWNVTAYPDGRLVNKSDNTEHYYLFWDGSSDTEWKFDEGFCVAGSDTEAFLRDKLAYMGLTPREYNDFITFWVPRLKNNLYNLITFSGEQYAQLAPLTVSPAPDSVLRVHMVYKPLAARQNIPEQKLKPFERKGFTVVEWGGSVG